MKLTKSALSAFVKHMLRTKSDWALRALQIIYERQTLDERRDRTTKHTNAMGFTSWDAEPLSILARKRVLKVDLSVGELRLVMLKMPKYWAQIIQVADHEKLVTAYEQHLMKGE